LESAGGGAGGAVGAGGADGAGGAAGAAASGRAKLNAVAKISRAFAASKSTKGGLASVRTAAQRAKNNGGGNNNVLTEPERRLSAQDPGGLGLGTLSEETEVAEAIPIEDLDLAAASNAGPLVLHASRSTAVGCSTAVAPHGGRGSL